MFKFNKVNIDGNNNIVFQDVDGETVTLTLDAFIEKFTEEKDKRIATLEKLIAKTESLSELQIRDAGKELQDAIKEREQLKDSVKKLVQDFNGKNLTDTSDYYKEAFALFLNGNVEEAIRILNTRNVQVDLAEIEREEALVKAKVEKINLARKKLADERVFNAQLLSIADKSVEAKKAYAEAIAINKDFDSLGGYAFYLHFLHEFDVAYDLFIELLKLPISKEQQSVVLNELGLIETARTNLPEAAGHLADAMKIDTETGNDLNLARTALHLGNLAMKFENFDKAIQAYNLAEKTYQALQDASEDKSRYNTPLAHAKSNLGSVYLEKNLFIEAEKNYLESLELYGEAMKTNDDLMPDLARALAGTARLYSSAEKFERSIEWMNEAVIYFRVLTTKNPSTYEFDLAESINNLGIIHERQSHYADAIRNFEEAIEIGAKYEKAFPNIYKSNVANFYNNLGLVYEHTGAFEKSEENYLASIQRKRELTDKNADVYRSLLALSVGNLAVLYERMQRTDDALKFHNEALTLYQLCEEKSPTDYLPDIGRTYRNIGVLYEGLGDFVKAVEKHELALKTYLSIKTDFPEAFEGEIADVKLSLAVALLNSGKFQDGVKYLTEANATLGKLYLEVPERYYQKYALTLINIVKLAFTNKTAANSDLFPILTDAANILTKFQHLGNPMVPALLDSILEVEEILNETPTDQPINSSTY